MKTSKTKVTASATPTVSGTPPKKTKREGPQPFRLQWWHYGLMLLGVVLIAFEIYGPALDGPFVLDDIYLPFMNPALANRPLQAWINVLPLLLLLTDYWFNPGFRLDGLKRNWRLYGLVLAGGAFGVFAVLTVLRYSPSAGFNLRDLHWYEYLFTQFRSICVYLRLFVLPV